jgi:hypothetical protein
MNNPEIDNSCPPLVGGIETYRHVLPVKLTLPEPDSVKKKPFHGLVAAPLTYLAVPYSYKSPDKRITELVQRFRFEAVTRAAGYLINTCGWNILSPITHSHPIHVLYPEVKGDWNFWKRIDTEFIQLSCRFVILTLPGWRESTGVAAEIEIARGFGIPFQFIHPTHDGSFNLTDLPHSEDYRVQIDLV